MVRILAIAGLLLVMTVNWTGAADIFKCKRADGTVVFADTPSPGGVDCQMERIEDLPPLGILPPSSPRQVPAPAPAANQPAPAPTNAGGELSFEEFKGMATQLVEDFTAARRRSFRSSFVEEELAANRELKDIRAQKATLLKQLERAELTGPEKREIAGVLSAITD